MNKTIMHVNYGEMGFNNYGSNTIDSICKMAAETGFDGIEFRGNPPANLKEMPFAEYVAQIAECKKKYGLSDIIFNFHLSACTSADKEARQKDVATVVEKVRLVNEHCGTTLCNTFGSKLNSPIPSASLSAFEFHGSAVATAEDWDLTADAYQLVGRELEKIGVKFAFETHMFYMHDVPSQVMKLVNMIDSPAIGVNMDYGNTIYFPNHPSVEDTIDMYGDKLFYTHLKNSTPIPGMDVRMPTALGDGEINHRSYLAKLKEVGFTGPIGIEAPRAGDRAWYAKQDYLYFKSVMETMQ